MEFDNNTKAPASPWDMIKSHLPVAAVIGGLALAFIGLHTAAAVGTSLVALAGLHLVGGVGVLALRARRTRQAGSGEVR